jgi:carbon monoxide dehydrogenase subunit G
LASAAVNFLLPVAPLPPLVVEAVDAFLVALLGGMGSRDMRKETRSLLREAFNEVKERVRKR